MTIENTDGTKVTLDFPYAVLEVKSIGSVGYSGIPSSSVNGYKINASETKRITFSGHTIQDEISIPETKELEVTPEEFFGAVHPNSDMQPVTINVRDDGDD